MSLANAKILFSFLRIFGHSMALLGVRRGFKMILSHIPLTSLNMSSYRAIWTHFRQNFIFFEQTISYPGPKILIQVQKNTRSWSQNPGSGSIKLFLLGGFQPPRLEAPQTPWRGACSPPCPPAYRGAPPLGLSVNLGTKILVPRSLGEPVPG